MNTCSLCNQYFNEAGEPHFNSARMPPPSGLRGNATIFLCLKCWLHVTKKFNQTVLTYVTQPLDPNSP